jgi:hypothetical protein
MDSFKVLINDNDYFRVLERVKEQIHKAQYRAVSVSETVSFFLVFHGLNSYNLNNTDAVCIHIEEKANSTS